MNYWRGKWVNDDSIDYDSPYEISSHLQFCLGTPNSTWVLAFVDTMKSKIEELAKDWEIHEAEASFYEDLWRTLVSWVEKAWTFLSSPLWNENKWFLHWVNDAWITPNNIVTLRVFTMTPIWIALIESWQEELWFLVLLIACLFDKLDWTIAEKFNKKSIAWQLYDAWWDKITEIAISLYATYILAINWAETEALISLILVWLKAYQHYQTQTRKWRPPLKEQWAIFYNSALRDEYTTFVEKKTSWAAWWAWKFKTLFQFVWSLLVIFAWKNQFDLWETNSILNFIGLWLWATSLWLWYLSWRWKK